MVDPLSQRTAPTSLAEPAGYRISRNIRRPRHIRDTATTQAHLPKSRNNKVANTRHLQIHQPSKHRNARADTAVRPYAEIFPSKIRDSVGQPLNAPRGGMLSTSAGRRKCFSFAVVMPVCTGDFGTRVRHLPRKRIHTGQKEPIICQVPSARADTAVSPYAEIVLYIAQAHSNLLERKN